MAIEAPVLAAIIGGAASLAGAGATAASTALSNRRQYKWSKEFFNYQQQYNQEHYSPAVSMQRLRDAGINPHEVAGTPGSGMSMQGSISTPQYQSPIAGLSDQMQAAIGTALNVYQTKKSLQNQTDLIQSQINKNVADAAKTNFQTQNILPLERDYQANRVKMPLYQIGTMKLQQQKMLNEISMFSMQKQKFQLALDLMQLEKDYQEEYYKYRNQSVKYDAMTKKSESGMRALDLKNYQSFGIRPQDPYYARFAANVTDRVSNSNSRFGRWLHSLIYGD